MIFVDEARIFVKAGDGGQGCESFYRDKHMRHPRPDGGDGGRGGDVIFIANKSIQTLLDFKFKQHYKAKKGGNASSKGKTGRNGENFIIPVPIGTIIRNDESKALIKDLVDHGQSVIVARGGGGGIGNENKKTPVPPQKGDELIISLELKLIADVGIVGFPNAGKSTFITQISKVKSKIANYPFTTKQPILGIVHGDDFDFIIADLPGIIEGAHLGKGLGHQFLRHAERNKILLHMIDMAGTEGRDPLSDYDKLNIELDSYSENLHFKHKIVVANKCDLPEAEENIRRFKDKYQEELFVISAIENNGIDSLVERIREIICLENSPDP